MCADGFQVWRIVSWTQTRPGRYGWHARWSFALMFWKSNKRGMGFILLREEQVDLHHIGRFGLGRSANSHQQISMSNSIFHPRGATPLIQGAFFLGRAGIQVDSLANGACGRDVPAADAWMEEPVLGSWMGECLSEIVLQRMLRLHELATSFITSRYDVVNSWMVFQCGV